MPHFHSKTFRTLFGSLFTLCALGSTGARAEDYSQTSVQIAYTGNDRNDFVMGTGTGGGSRETVRFEHFGTYALGDNYIMFDAYHGDQLGEGNSSRQNFFVWNSHLSLGKLAGKDLSWGPIQDVFAMGRLEVGSYGSYRAGALGAGLYWNLPFTKGSLLETSILARRKDYMLGATDVRDTGALYRLYFLIPFQVMGLNATASGPFYLSPISGGGNDFYMEPEVFVSFGPKDVFSVGVRVEYHKVTGNNVINSSGDASRTTTNLAFRWNW